MKNKLYLLALLVLLMHLPTMAQIGGDYNPDNPGDPGQSTRYQLSLRAEPENSGTFVINYSTTNNERFVVGSTYKLVATAKTDYVFKYWRIGDSILSTNQEYVDIMPAHNVEIIGQFEYNPSNPGDPNPNYWNPLTGEVIIDSFTPGGLYEAIKALLSRSNSTSTEVKSITVIGQMGSLDFGIEKNYKNCAILDLRGVTGVNDGPFNELPEKASYNSSSLESVYLPASIEKIGNQAFYNCTNLSSLTIYAITPPSLGTNVFSGVPEGLVVYVHESAIYRYQDDPEWGKFFIQPIREDVNTILTVNLPASVNPADYANMLLELTNTKNGQQIHYVMTDKSSYKFSNIICNSTWNVVLRNSKGDVFGRIDNVVVRDNDMTVTFDTLSKPYKVSLSVLTPSGQDVTSSVDITWTDASGNHLSQSPTVTGLPIGYRLTYSIRLPRDLAMAYNMPASTQYTVTDGDNAIVCRLLDLTLLTVSGKVKDANTGLPIYDANITASQTIGGKYDKTMNVNSDKDGTFSLEMVNVPTTVIAASSAYITQTIDCDLSSGNGTIVLPDISLHPITGATVTVDLNYTPAHAEGETSVTQNWYSDYNNVDYTIYNKTSDRGITNISVQYPLIVLLEDVNDGDVLELTATSRKEIFAPVKTNVTIAEQKATATFNIVEMGKIEASFNRNENPTVIGTLYDADGKLENTYQYKNDASLTISNLSDGHYTLVTMGGSLFFNSIYELSELSQTGLTAGVDYVQKSIEVKSGIISSVSIDEVPTFDETKLYYTGENTSFTVNKPSIVIGNYLTLTGYLDFKPAYAGHVNNVSMIVDIPENCVFVENSVMVENSTSAYSVSGNRITIPMIRYTDRVRLCVIPTASGNHALGAFAQFDLNGKTITQPIGAANFVAQDLSISVPPIVAKTVVTVSGTSVGKSSVNVYDNDVLIGQTTSLENGTWSCECELNNAYQASRHVVHAKVAAKEGLELLTNALTCTYDENFIQVSKVTQYNEQLGPTPYLITFDFLHPSNQSQYYGYDDNRSTFTYTIDFTNNQGVRDVILYVKTAKNHWWPLKAFYDEAKDLWVTEGKFGNSLDADLPINVGLDYRCVNSFMLDSATIIGDLKNDYRYAEIVNLCNRNDVLSFSIVPIDKSNSRHLAYSKMKVENKPRLYDILEELGFSEISLNSDTDIKVYCNQNYGIHKIIERTDSIFTFALFNSTDSLSFMHYLSLMRGDTISVDMQNLFKVQNKTIKNESGIPDWYIQYDRNDGERVKQVIDEINDIFIETKAQDKDFDLSIHRSYVDIILSDMRLIEADSKACAWSQFWTIFNSFSTSSDAPSAAETLIIDINPWTGVFDHSTYRDTNKSLIESWNSKIGNLRALLSDLPGYSAADGNPNVQYTGLNAYFIVDPSGFVYEGVPSNRLQGVTATCYYKETVEDMYGDLYENVVLWEAEQYGQENPLLTDENGFYRWDVPIGMWQVKYEKEGYETTYSDWLPVPPPQLDVNIGMVQMRQPEVIKARAYPQAVELEFDKFMLPETLTEDNITVSVDGTEVIGTIELLNAEIDDPNAITSLRRAPGTGLTFASKVRFNADRPFNADHVTLHVKHNVESYAGLQMNDDYEAVLDVEYEMTQIVADTTINVMYGDSHEMTVTVLPAKASQGKTLNVRSISPMIVTTDAETYTLDINGKAVITVNGELPGMSSLLFDIDGYDLRATTLVNVKMESEMTVATPTASIASGSEVEKGTAVYLYCKTEGATIYYTLDGSCPCDNTEGRMVYDGTPIIINSDVTIKAMATCDGLYDSYVATFVYHVSGLKGDVNSDGTVNIADINLLIDYILRDRINSETLQRGDVNGDGDITIADINVVIQIILGGSGANMPVNTPDLLHMSNLAVRPGETGTLCVTVDNASRYSAMQCDIVLPDGLTLVDVTAAGGCVVKTGMVDDVTSRALTYSMTQLPFTDGSQPVLTLTVRADAALADMSHVTLADVVLADADGVAWYADDCTAMVNNASGINDLNCSTKQVASVRYYNVAGQEMTRPEGMTIQVTTYTDGTRSATRLVK